MTADDLVGRAAEGPLSGLVGEGDLSVVREAQDGAVGVLHRLVVPAVESPTASIVLPTPGVQE